MTTQTLPTKPADLSIYVLHSPEAIRQHAAETRDYFNEIRKIEHAEAVRAQAILANANRPSTDDEYFAQAQKREAENQAKQAERAATEKADALAEIDRLLASPPTVEVVHRNEFLFLQKVIQYAGRGYVMTDDGFLSFTPGMYHIVMNSPQQAAKKVAQK